MKIVKQLLLIASLLGLMASMNAQDQSRSQHRIERLKEALQLTDEQTAKISDIMTRNEQKGVQEKAAKPLNKKGMMKSERVRLKEMDKEIEPLLNAQQLKKYESYKKERANQMLSRTKGRKFKE